MEESPLSPCLHRPVRLRRSPRRSPQAKSYPGEKKMGLFQIIFIAKINILNKNRNLIKPLPTHL